MLTFTLIGQKHLDKTRPGSREQAHFGVDVTFIWDHTDLHSGSIIYRFKVVIHSNHQLLLLSLISQSHIFSLHLTSFIKSGCEVKDSL